MSEQKRGWYVLRAISEGGRTVGSGQITEILD